MNTDDNDKLWKLLGDARRPEVSPFFSRNVLRAVREEEAREEETRPLLTTLRGFTRALHRWSWRLAIGGTCVIVALISVSPAAFRHHQAGGIKTGVTRQIAGDPDYEVIKHLDELVADEESSIWLDDSAR